ncbi:MAG: FkbM family methyltransferase [Verrucomicrobia bacterium]|nr:FkbM family methyltransferase [Verrucomicrobiota bacterium]
MPDLIRSLKNLRYRIFYGALLRRANLLEFGNRGTGCSWFFCPDGLNKDSVIYGGGVGRDVTFEQALAKHFECNVVLFDPSPTGLETMLLPENKIPQFHFVPVGLSGSNCTLRFAPPPDLKEGSWFTDGSAAATIEVPCVDLSTLMKQNGHDRIDLLKIDIEGAEYDVLDHLLGRKLRVRQVLVEFHHNILPGIPRSKSIRYILKMVTAGYKLLNQDGANHTFYHPSI